MKYYIIKRKNKDGDYEYKSFNTLRVAKRFMHQATTYYCVEHDDFRSECGCTPSSISLHQVDEKLIERRGRKNV